MSVKEAQHRECLEEAFRWCCKRRRAAPPDADIWHLWFHWQGIKEGLLTALTENRYRLSAMQVVGRGKDRQAIWSAQDAVVLKWVAMQLHDILPVHPLCEHHKGHGAEDVPSTKWPAACRQPHGRMSAGWIFRDFTVTSAGGR